MVREGGGKKRIEKRMIIQRGRVELHAIEKQRKTSKNHRARILAVA